MKTIVIPVSWVHFNRWEKPGNWSNIHLITRENDYKPLEKSKALCSRVVPADRGAMDWGLGRKRCERCYDIANKRGMTIQE